MPVNRYWMPVILIVALFGTILLSQALGLWSTSGRTSVDMETMSPADIKGWMTIQQVADGLQIKLDQVYAAGGIPTDISPDTALKNLEGLVEGFETTTLREAFAAPPAEVTPDSPA